MNKKGYLQISFSWLFAIIVGAVVIFLAIYFAGKMIKTEGTIQVAKSSKEIGILLNPLETSFESAITRSLTFPGETRFNNKCDNRDNFGNQGIQIMQKSSKTWVETDIDSDFQNKYIFSERRTEGKTFYIFSKPFEFPFKVANLIYITSASTNYCFIDAPNDIKKEISDLKEKQLNLKLEGECSEDDVKVCFERSGCDIKVNYDAGYVEKYEKMYFETDALMYAAIFSDENIYECQLKRLMQRIEQLSDLYMDKEDFIGQRCDSDLGGDLLDLKDSAYEFEYSEDIYLVNNIVEKLENKNKGDCRLW